MVRANGCKDLPVRIKKGRQVISSRNFIGVRVPEGLALWSCVVTVRRSLAMPVLVAVNRSSEVFWLWPDKLEKFTLK